MEIGPVEYIVIAFPGNQFSGEIIPALQELVSNGTVRILDLTVVQKDADGNVITLEVNEMGDNARAFLGLDYEVGGLLNEEDLLLIADHLPNDTTAALMVWEDVWATRFAQAVRKANGMIVENARVPREIVMAAVNYTDEQ
ncbi:DUF6325 family protein [Promineifilum sp.]|uniref:DUF6325 family protein n=1 Tax=Promineifilum sp. TaxID=2664178 RepID=UPI0035B2D65F